MTLSVLESNMVARQPFWIYEKLYVMCIILIGYRILVHNIIHIGRNKWYEAKRVCCDARAKTIASSKNIIHIGACISEKQLATDILMDGWEDGRIGGWMDGQGSMYSPHPVLSGWGLIKSYPASYNRVPPKCV